MKALAAACLFLLTVACGAPQPADAQAPARSVAVADSWAAPMPAGVDVAAGYLTIANSANAPDRLLGVTSPRADRVEVHEMTMNGSVMQMRPVARLQIPARGSVQLARGGLHLMFFGVSEPFVEGQTIPVHLVFERAGEVEVSLAVRRQTPHRH